MHSGPNRARQGRDCGLYSGLIISGGSSDHEPNISEISSNHPEGRDEAGDVFAPLNGADR
jgi:hypothetical protein